jgi:tetratricopeptide (TPR) repeat protein
MALKNLNKILKDAITAYNRKNIDEARILFFEVLDEDPTNPEANYYLGLIYSREENYPKAVIHLKAIVDLGANFLFTQQCRMILGMIYYKTAEYERAEREFTEVLNSRLNMVQVHAALAAVYSQMGNKDKALQHAGKAYNMDQYNLNAKNTYAYLLSEYEVDIPKSLEILREVIRIKPDNAAYLDSLGWAYYKSGDAKASLASLKKGLEINMKDPDLNHHYEIVTGKDKLKRRYS